MDYKKFGFWVVGVAVILGVAVSVGLIVNPMKSTSLAAVINMNLNSKKIYIKLQLEVAKMIKNAHDSW